MSGVSPFEARRRAAVPAHRRQGAARCIILALAVSLGWACFTGRRPSIVLLLVDTLRADHLGVYGFPADTSPHIDRLAAESAVFTRTFSPAPWTKPAVASLFTSLYPETHGLTNHEGRYWGGEGAEGTLGVLPEGALTLAEALRGEGYRTGAFHANPWMLEKYGFDQGFEVYTYHPRTEGVLAGARRWLATLSGDEPFFLYVHVMDVHAPYSPVPAHYQALRRSAALGPERPLNDRERGAIPSHLDGPPLLSEAERGQLKAWRAKYAATVRTMDERVGAFLDALRRAGTLDRSFVVVTADHGEELLEHGGWDHGSTLYSEQLHVPLVVRAPGGRGGGRRVEDLVSLVDLMPTMLAWAGGRPPAGRAQGRPIPALVPDGADPALESFSSSVFGGPGLHSVRTADHTFILDVAHGRGQLFDRTSDPQERSDIAGRQPQAAARLRGHLLRHLAELAARSPLPRQGAPVSPELLERLRSLGYLR